MGGLFLTVLNMSLTASYVILCVMIVRLFIKKAPKAISYALWSVVAFRLTVPFSLESMFSLLPRGKSVVSVPVDVTGQLPPVNIIGTEIPVAGVKVSLFKAFVETGAYIWVLGMAVLVVYSLVSVYLLKRQLKGARLVEKNVYEAENLKTPFVLGVINPRIYLPAGLGNEERSYILMHEQAGDGSLFEPSIREFCTMPVSGKEIPGLADKMLEHYGNKEDILILQKENLAKHLRANGVGRAILYNSQGEVEFPLGNR